MTDQSAVARESPGQIVARITAEHRDRYNEPLGLETAVAIGKALKAERADHEAALARAHQAGRHEGVVASESLCVAAERLLREHGAGFMMSGESIETVRRAIKAIRAALPVSAQPEEPK